MEVTNEEMNEFVCEDSIHFLPSMHSLKVHS